MDGFSAKPGAPNVYRVVGSYANEIQPGKQPLYRLQNDPRKVVSSESVRHGDQPFYLDWNCHQHYRFWHDASGGGRRHPLSPSAATPDLITTSIANPLPDQTRLALRSVATGWSPMTGNSAMFR